MSFVMSMKNLAATAAIFALGSMMISGVSWAVTGPTISANKFNSMLAVDTHLGYTDGTYGLIKNSSGQYVRADAYVKAAADYIGIYTFRDGVTDGSNGSSSLSYYQAMAKLGINFIFVAKGNTQADLTKSLQLIDTVNQTPGAEGRVIAIEGANEINNAPLCWGPVPCIGGLTGALNRQATLANLVRNSTSIPKIPQVYYFTGWDGVVGAPGPNPVPTYADANNQHPYPNFGQPPYFWLSRSQALKNTTNSSQRAVFTETGYQVGPLYGSACNNGAGGVCWNNNNTWHTKPQVSEAVQAKLTLAIPFDAALLNIEKVAFYELLTAYPEKGRIDQGFGMFRYSATGVLIPRPVATALRNLTSLTKDSGTVSTVTKLDYQVTGLPTQGYCPNVDPSRCTFTPTLALQKSNGQYLIAVWAEQNIWNNTTFTEIAGKPYPTTITLPKTYSKIEVFDPYKSGSPIATYGSANSVQVTVVDRPLLVRVTP
jgi:hypothetical protein